MIAICDVPQQLKQYGSYNNLYPHGKVAAVDNVGALKYVGSCPWLYGRGLPGVEQGRFVVWAMDRMFCLAGQAETVALAIMPSKKVVQSSTTGNAPGILFNTTRKKKEKVNKHIKCSPVHRRLPACPFALPIICDPTCL